jgi:hypothetical protein
MRYIIPALFIAALVGALAAIGVLMEWTLMRAVGVAAIGAGFTALSFWLYRRMFDDDL